MKAHRIWAAFFAFAAVTAAAAGSAAAQEPVPMKLTVVAGARTETLRGTGRCAHEPHASIYGHAAGLWTAEHATGARQVSLTYWRLAAAGAGEQFNLSVDGPKAHHRINTVQGSTPAGSGRATFRPTATGGRFEIRGKAADGTPLQVTIECARFGGIYAEGG